VSIKAIETSYAGCRFRSRLEARWAVFFDRLAIRWQYEPQGYVIGPDYDRRPYLPDFWLPVEKLWVEVKGAESDLDHRLILNAVIPHWGLPGVERDRPSMLVLGPVPRPGGRIGHSALDFHKGDVWRGLAEFSVRGLAIYYRGAYIAHDDDWLGSDSGDVATPDPGLTEPQYLPGTPGSFVTEAYTAARSARFEHGQHG
jgi:hypothetical protein